MAFGARRGWLAVACIAAAYLSSACGGRLGLDGGVIDNRDTDVEEDAPPEQEVESVPDLACTDLEAGPSVMLEGVTQSQAYSIRSTFGADPRSDIFVIMGQGGGIVRAPIVDWRGSFEAGEAAALANQGGLQLTVSPGPEDAFGIAGRFGASLRYEHNIDVEVTYVEFPSLVVDRLAHAPFVTPRDATGHRYTGMVLEAAPSAHELMIRSGARPPTSMIPDPGEQYIKGLACGCGVTAHGLWRGDHLLLATTNTTDLGDCDGATDVDTDRLQVAKIFPGEAPVVVYEERFEAACRDFDRPRQLEFVPRSDGAWLTMWDRTLLFDDAGTVVLEAAPGGMAVSRLGNGFVSASRSQEQLGLTIYDQDGEEVFALSRPELSLDHDELELIDVIGDPRGESLVLLTANRELGGVLAERFDCVP